MPISTYPPFSGNTGAITSPRTLQRWLDVNQQNGSLQRAQTFITLPAMSIASTWNGDSDIMATVNFEAPNNFTLKSLSGLASTPNYFLTIMWKDQSGNTHRYAIWSGVGEVVDFAVPPYTNQIIKKNCRLEIWSVGGYGASYTIVQTAAINIYTSVLQSLDYRYANDGKLAGTDATNTNMSVNTSGGAFTLPIVFPSTSQPQPNTV